MFRFLRTAGVVFLLGVAVPVPSYAAEEVIPLGVGSQKVLTLPGVFRVAVGSREIAQVKALSGEQLLVTGVREGRTTLTVWKTGGKKGETYVLHVRKQDPEELAVEVRKSLGDVEGVAVRVVGDKVVLDGQAYTQRDAEAVQKTLSLYPSVKNFVKTGTVAKTQAAQQLTEVFQRSGLRSVQINLVGSTLFLEGSVESVHELHKAELMVKAMGEPVENLLTVGIKRMILSEVQFVEVRHSSRDRVGVKYPTDLAGAVTGSLDLRQGLLGNLTSGDGQMVARVAVAADLAAGFQLNEGHGRILAQPRLVCASGEQAEFLAGGEVPIPLVTQTQATVEYKPYGVILRIKPTADSQGNIQTELEAEASEVDNALAVSVGGSMSVPGFRTRKVRTNVTLRQGETIILSGVFSHDEQKSVSRIPGIGSIPIIGELFKSRGMDSSKRELLIFVTPKIIQGDSERGRTMIEEVKERYKEARDEVGMGLLD